MHPMSTQPPQYPHTPPPSPLPHNATLESLQPHIQQLADAPSILRQAVDGLTPEQLDTRYRNWTLRQITHHIADSHLHALIRYKWALTEPNPTIKPYDENLWTALQITQSADIELSLNLLDAIHASWIALINTLTLDQLNRTFVHPEFGTTVRIADMIPSYAWHVSHHAAQITWRRNNPI